MHILKKIENKLCYTRTEILHALGYNTPIALILYLTRQCNLRCPHCLYLLYNKDFFSTYELKLVHAKDILSYFKTKYRLTKFCPSAEGEVFLYDGLEELVQFALKIGYKKTSIATNGLLLHKYVDFALNYLDHVTISLDGYDAETYAAYRGGGKSTFDRIVSNIILLVKEKNKNPNKNISVTINCIIGKSNLRYIEPMIRLAEYLKVDHMRFGNYHPTDEGASGWKPLYSGDKEVEDCYRRILADTGWKVSITLPSLYGKRRRFRCTSLFNGVQIGANGSFSPCCHITCDDKYGNFFIKPNGFNEKELLLFRRKFLAAEDHSQLPSFCRECPRLSPWRYKFFLKEKKWHGSFLDIKI